MDEWGRGFEVEAKRHASGRLFLAASSRPDSLRSWETGDAYSAFYARGSALGWLTPAAEGGSSDGVWGMNEAELDGVRSDGRVAWFQVVPTRMTVPRPVVVATFVDNCAATVRTLVGDDLQAVDLSLPAVPEMGSAAPAEDVALSPLEPVEVRVHRSVESALGWFPDAPSDADRVPVRLTLNGGPDSSVRAAVEELHDVVNAARQHVLKLSLFSLADQDHRVAQHVEVSDIFAGRHERASLFGTVSEWSWESVGWIASLFADLLPRYGVTGVTALSVERL